MQDITHHVDDHKRWDFSEAIAIVTQHPSNPNIWGRKNLSNDGLVKDMETGRSVTLGAGIKINFGKAEGEIRQ